MSGAEVHRLLYFGFFRSGNKFNFGRTNTKKTGFSVVSAGCNIKLIADK
jgi:hypothetical protein